MNLRSIAAVGSIFLLAVATPARSETAEELLAKNLEARGGADKLSAIHSYVTKGELRLPGDFKLSYTETRLRLDAGSDACAVRVDASIQGLTDVQVYDGKIAWHVNPFRGRKDPEQLNSDEARELADEGSIDGALLAAKTKGSKVEYLGREDIDGTQAYKLRVSQTDGTVFTYYLDPDVYLEIKVVEDRTIRGAEHETETNLGDYERVAGVYFPFSIASGPLNSPDSAKQVITVESAEANVDVPQSLFALPGQAIAQSK